MSDVSTNLYKSQLLDYYYQRRAESSINKGSRFLISKAVFGTSSLVTKKEMALMRLENCLRLSIWQN
ncbi:putative tail fiber structure or assembly [Escherichia coli]|nr:putative tail fiber structure or assembly [Escherichia coli]